MNKHKLKKIKIKLQRLQSKPNNIRSKELVSLATSLGRKIFDRGKEPTYISDLLPKSRPISIPNHPGAMAKGTALNILDQLESDIFYLEEIIKE